MKLIFASNNAHKLEEVRRILDSVEVVSLKNIGFYAEIDETGETLNANSLLKAQTIWDWVQAQGICVDGVFADDTGLEISALGMQPGVRTARWAGEPACDKNNRQKALLELNHKDDRTAQFRTIITMIIDGQIQQVEGCIRGHLSTEERGDGGFGYDPLFIPEGYDKTFAELPAEVKNTISHRARALDKMKQVLGL